MFLLYSLWFFLNIFFLYIFFSFSYSKHLDQMVNVPLQTLNQPLLDDGELSSAQMSRHLKFYLSKTRSIYAVTPAPTPLFLKNLIYYKRFHGTQPKLWLRLKLRSHLLI